MFVFLEFYRGNNLKCICDLLNVGNRFYLSLDLFRVYHRYLKVYYINFLSIGADCTKKYSCCKYFVCICYYYVFCRSCSVNDFIIWTLFLLISRKLLVASISNPSIDPSCPVTWRKNLCELICNNTSYCSPSICVKSAWIAPNCTCLVRSVLLWNIAVFIWFLCSR